MCKEHFNLPVWGFIFFDSPIFGHLILPRMLALWHSWRSCLLILVASCMELCRILENPATSLMFSYCRMRETIRMLRKAGLKAGAGTGQFLVSFGNFRFERVFFLAVCRGWPRDRPTWSPFGWRCSTMQRRREHCSGETLPAWWGSGLASSADPPTQQQCKPPVNMLTLKARSAMLAQRLWRERRAPT